MVFGGDLFRLAIGDTAPLLVLLAAAYFSARNAFASRGHIRLFWGLVTAGMLMWSVNQASWVWFEVVLRRPLPDPFGGDLFLFLHIVPLMAAVAIRPHEKAEGHGMRMSVLNIITLLIWWVVVYAFFVFPQEYIVTDRNAYTLRWDLLYLVEGLMLIGMTGTAFFSSSGAWRKIYGGIFGASIFYSVASEAMNAAIARGSYRTAGPYDLPFLASLLWFLAVTLQGKRLLREGSLEPVAEAARRQASPVFVQLALLSLPLIGYAALFVGQEPAYLRRIRFAVAMGGIAILAFLVFLKQYVLDQRLVVLLNRARKSFDELQRWQGRAIQQAKLASLGELVALAASELDYPLATVAEGSERIAASDAVTAEQIATARKIGQQARRTRDLVGDLLSFAQQTAGEKVNLELKPLLDRALQMEGFKVENRQISMGIESAESLPPVLGNANQLLQAFLQIIENAVEAMQGVGAGHLSISAWREEGEVVIQFLDSGPGLEHPERVFDPFYTTKPVGKGTGLGLSATYGVIHDHKGQITCFNRPEGGAAFEIRLPALNNAGVSAAAGA